MREESFLVVSHNNINLRVSCNFIWTHRKDLTSSIFNSTLNDKFASNDKK